jgi:hypothetical protein
VKKQIEWAFKDVELDAVFLHGLPGRSGGGAVPLRQASRLGTLGNRAKWRQGRLVHRLKDPSVSFRVKSRGVLEEKCGREMEVKPASHEGMKGTILCFPAWYPRADFSAPPSPVVRDQGELPLDPRSPRLCAAIRRR